MTHRRSSTSRRRPPARSRRRTRRSSAGRGGVAVVLSLAVVLLLVGGAGWLGTSFVRGLFAPPPDYSGTGHGRVLVRVTPGDSLAEVGRVLKASDVVKSVDAFLSEAGDNAQATSLQAGYYALRRQMSAQSALQLLLDERSRVEGGVTIPEGSRLSEILDQVTRKSKITRKDLVAALEDPDSIGLPSYAKGHPEGYLFPATYVVDPGTTAQSLLSEMVRRFQQAADGVDLAGRADALGLSPSEAVVVASLVEAEARHAKDYPKVARVVYNRLAADMPLQFDSTVNYALEADKTTVTLQDLQTDSPYNTYRNRGLPPGPINSPGEAALEAALEPAKGDWLYFVSVDDAGTTKFTSSYQEFLRFKAEFKSNQG